MKRWKWQIEEENDRKKIRNRVYLLLKEHKGYFKNAAGEYVDVTSDCVVCEEKQVEVRVLEDGVCPFCICRACAKDYQACFTLLASANTVTFI